MNALILNEENRAAIETLNSSGDPSRQLNPVPLTNGNRVLNADLLTDCGPGQTWEHYASLLQSLTAAELADAEFASANIA